MGKIQTADCVLAITKHFFDQETDNHTLLRPSLWKRVSKSGSGEKIIRIFQNKETGTIVKVLSSETEIFKIIEGTPPISNIKDYLREKFNKLEHGFYELSYEIVEDITNWPQVKLVDEEETFDEPQDTENFEWLSIDDTEMVIACGGDWQEPLTLTIRLVNGKLAVVNTTPGYAEGMNEKTFIDKISNQ